MITKYVPNSITRFVGRTGLKISAKSPTILVVSGVVGLGATAVMAARASKNAQPVIDNHKKGRAEIGIISKATEKHIRKEQQAQLIGLYVDTTKSLARVYGPTIAVGTVSAASVLWGHRILRGRHVATMAAYSGMMEQFTAYRDRVRKTLGEKAELDIFHGAHGEWVEDPDHKGEYKLQPKYEESPNDGYVYFRPWFDETKNGFKRDPSINYMWLKGIQAHQNKMLQVRGYVMLNDVFDDLGWPRVPEGQVMGWLRDTDNGDGYIDFGFMTGQDPHTQAFREGKEATVRLNFNVDNEPIWQQIGGPKRY